MQIHKETNLKCTNTHRMCLLQIWATGCSLTQSWTGVALMQICSKSRRKSLHKYKIQIHIYPKNVFCNLTQSWTGVVLMQICAKRWRKSFHKYKIQIHIYPNTQRTVRCLLQPHSVMDWGGGDANMHKESGKIRQLDAIQDFAALPSAYKRRKRQICATSMNHRHA